MFRSLPPRSVLPRSLFCSCITTPDNACMVRSLIILFQNQIGKTKKASRFLFQNKNRKTVSLKTYLAAVHEHLLFATAVVCIGLHPTRGNDHRPSAAHQVAPLPRPGCSSTQLPLRYTYYGLCCQWNQRTGRSVVVPSGWMKSDAPDFRHSLNHMLRQLEALGSAAQLPKFFHLTKKIKVRLKRCREAE